MTPNTGTRTLETPRLILRRFTAEDAQPMFDRWASDPLVTEHLTWPPHGSVDVTRMLLADWVARYEQPDYYNWAIGLKGLDGPIGGISVVQLIESPARGVRCGEIGYCMGRAWWGQGLMPEAFRAVIAYLFDTAGFMRLRASHAAANPKSGRVMQKVGMTRCGVERRAGADNTGIVDMVIYDMLPDDPRP
ncbi:MAG: GNAT family N-acetyltransferase [Clostridia bacterium]|nr:GNAT family N-acetyltransferase [Clostridia bacterium]